MSRAGLIAPPFPIFASAGRQGEAKDVLYFGKARRPFVRSSAPQMVGEWLIFAHSWPLSNYRIVTIIVTTRQAISLGEGEPRRYGLPHESVAFPPAARMGGA